MWSRKDTHSAIHAGTVTSIHNPPLTNYILNNYLKELTLEDQEGPNSKAVRPLRGSEEGSG